MDVPQDIMRNLSSEEIEQFTIKNIQYMLQNPQNQQQFEQQHRNQNPNI
jgi:hypothetical protein